MCEKEASLFMRHLSSIVNSRIYWRLFVVYVALFVKIILALMIHIYLLNKISNYTLMIENSLMVFCVGCDSIDAVCLM